VSLRFVDYIPHVLNSDTNFDITPCIMPAMYCHADIMFMSANLIPAPCIAKTAFMCGPVQ